MATFDLSELNFYSYILRYSLHICIVWVSDIPNAVIYNSRYQCIGACGWGVNGTIFYYIINPRVGSLKYVPQAAV